MYLNNIESAIIGYWRMVGDNWAWIAQLAGVDVVKVMKLINYYKTVR
jgi:hypothetical protein